MPPKPISRRQLKKRVLSGFKKKIRHAESLEMLAKLERAVKTAHGKEAIRDYPMKMLLKDLKKKRVPLSRKFESKRKELEFLGSVAIPFFAENPELVERSLEAHIKALRKKGVREWEAGQIAYREYVAKTGLGPLFDAFYSSAGRKLERERRGRIRDRGLAKAVRKGYKWETFHVSTDRLLGKFDFGNIYSLAKMFSRGKRKGIRILDFFPHEKYIELQVEIPTKEGIIRDIVAIEKMEKGEIKKLGNPVKYWAHEELKEKHFRVEGRDWLAEDEKSPYRAERYGKIMKALNDLVR